MHVLSESRICTDLSDYANFTVKDTAHRPHKRVTITIVDLTIIHTVGRARLETSPAEERHLLDPYPLKCLHISKILHK